MNDETLNWESLVRYLSKESTPEERQQIEERMASDPDFKTTVNNLREIWQGPIEAKKAWNVDEAWEQYVKQFGNPYEGKTFKTSASDVKVDVNTNDIAFKKKKIDNRTSIYRIGTIAAAAAAAILLVVLLYNTQTPQPEPVKKEIVTKYGQRMHIRLSDGSNVVLNAGSKLIVPKQFEGPAREVTLTGEAYFEITSNSNKPFLVHVKNGITRVLGTRFTVQAYPEDRQVEVVVVEGKVVLEPAERAMSTFNEPITKNHKGVLSEDGNTVISQISYIESYLGWTEGKLIFNDAPLKQIEYRLERWYAVSIRFDDSVPVSQRLTASFTPRQPLKEVLEAIALSLDLSYIKKDGKFTFHKKNQQKK